MISGCFPAASDTEAAFRIISRAWFKFSPLFEPILPSWINASVKDLKEFAMVVNSGWRQVVGADDPDRPSLVPYLVTTCEIF